MLILFWCFFSFMVKLKFGTLEVTLGPSAKKNSSEMHLKRKGMNCLCSCQSTVELAVALRKIFILVQNQPDQ